MKRRSRMVAISLSSDTHKDHGPVVEHIPNLITLYKDGHVERPPTVPHLHPSSSLHPSLTCRDHLIDPTTNLWGRLYLPKRPNATTLLVYFHGGGFCVGSASWSVYHRFLSRAASFLSCSILSVSYRLAPEHPLPSAYHDALAAVRWARQQQKRHSMDTDEMFLCGDSAGANVAYNTAVALVGDVDYIKGVVLMQPFFGSERRTWTERNSIQGADSVLSLTASDCYWRMALPRGADRDHEYCNPIGKAEVVGPMMVCVAEMDILRDGNLEFCEEVRRRGGDVDCVVYDGVGHAFQVLGSSAAAEVRTQMLLNDIKAFLIKHS